MMPWGQVWAFLIATLGITSLPNTAQRAPDLAEYFKPCRHTSPDFDECMQRQLNKLNFFFPRGVPKYDIPPFDPFFISEVHTKRQGLLLNYKLTLTDVLESGWTDSTVINFKSDLEKNRVTVLQYWPDKRLSGNYNFEINRNDGKNVLKNKGTFNLTLLGFNQATTLTRVPGEIDAKGVPQTRVTIQIQDVRDMKLHISNLVFGKKLLELLVDFIINSTWRPFYPLTKSIVNELVGKAFTKIFTRAFRSIPLDQFFPA